MSAESSNQATPEQILQSLVNTSYAKAKRWANTVLVLQVTLYAAGIVAVFVPGFGLAYPWAAIPLALVGAWLTACSVRHKGTGETLKRQHEYLDAFGRAPSQRQLSSVRVELPNRLRATLDQLLTEGITYASAKPVGSARALENLCESAWFSQHLAGSCASALRATFVLTLATAMTLLLFSALSIPGTPAGIAAAKCVSATLLFVLSVGVLRAWLSFQRFSRKAEQVDADAARFLERESPDAYETQRLLGEYQLSRAAAPLIPTWIWRLRRNHLNRIWADRINTK